MASRKEEKERLRQERLEAERQAQSAGASGIMIGYVVAGVLALLIVVGLVIALAGGSDSGSDSAAPRRGRQRQHRVRRQGPRGHPRRRPGRHAASRCPERRPDRGREGRGCDLRLNLKDEGSTHLDPQTDDLPDYGTNPPTSGDHYPGPARRRRLPRLPEPGRRSCTRSSTGGSIIQYSPDLSEEDQLALKGVFDADRPGVDLFPNPDMPYEVATTAWTQLMGCKSFEGDATLDAIRDFRDAYRGRGPEAIPF